MAALCPADPSSPRLTSCPCSGQDLLQTRSYIYAEEPNIDIHNFVGTFTRVSGR